jgi:[acyl-carrier-protein] S-malonyltransferase
VALIMTVEMAQLGLLREYFGIELGGSRLAFGYSLGEAAALVATGVYALEDMLPIPLKLADDCTALAADTTMAVLFSKGPALDLAAVQRRCLEISQEGKGTLAISSLLSPNTLLLLGQSTTLERFKKDLATLFPGAYLRRNQHLWPPLHTPIMWQRQIPNRAAVLFETARGGFRLPSVALLSGVTGKASYNDYNSRELLHRWVDHPQRLWDMVYETLMAGVNLVVHVGPEPNLIPATFKRLSDNVSEQLSGKTWKSFGLRAASHMVRRAWLTPLLSSRAALLRAPFVDHCNLEDWLLEQKPG